MYRVEMDDEDIFAEDEKEIVDYLCKVYGIAVYIRYTFNYLQERLYLYYGDVDPLSVRSLKPTPGSKCIAVKARWEK